MELGQRIKAARLEKGLSQRELCGTVITRNMLSLIENGSARPSMDTLRYLAGQLEKPISYFLDEAVPSPNQALILAARQVSGEQALLALRDYQAPDPVFDPEYYLISALAFMEMAQQALEEQLEQIRQDGYCISTSERDEGVSSITVPIFGNNHKILYSLGIVGEENRMNNKGPDLMREALLETAQRLHDLMSEFDRNDLVFKENLHTEDRK